jgi:hypothetical protein
MSCFQSFAPRLLESSVAFLSMNQSVRNSEPRRLCSVVSCPDEDVACPINKTVSGRMFLWTRLDE